MSDSENFFPFIKIANPVNIEPQATITNWSVHRVTFDDGDVSDHLVGFIHGKSGRVTSAIKSFDGNLRKIITQSGRIYTLVGTPGYSEDANYVWQNWKLKCRVIEDLDVSDEYAPKIRNIIN